MRRILTQRFFSAAAGTTKPYVFVNKFTKVICQGMTGKEVTPISNLIGNFPYIKGHRIRDQDGRRCLANEGWHQAFGPSSL